MNNRNKEILRKKFPLAFNIYRCIHNIILSFKEYREFNRLAKINKEETYKMYFSSWYNSIDDHVLVKFIKTRELLSNKNLTISFVHPFRESLRSLVKFIDTDIKVFYTGENLKRKVYMRHADHLLLEKDIDLALGFEWFENDRYIRFPLWLEYVFDFDSSESQIRERCKELRHPQIGKRNYKCTLIASHDESPIDNWKFGIRTQMCESIKDMVKIDCAGKFMHNDDTLKTLFNDNKVEYLKQYTFNICPENTNSYGYVTEKVFESILAGCIPIYWGSYNSPEIDILNYDAILFYDPQNPQKLKAKIRDLLSDPAKLEEFINQPRLKDGAEDIIIAKFKELEQKLKDIIESKLTDNIKKSNKMSY